MTTPAFSEPSFAPWREVPIKRVIERIVARAAERAETPLRTLAVDGRSGAGKSTLAASLARELPQAALVHTDDVAWHHSFFDWQDELIGQILAPARAGRAVHWRPPPWIERGREGAIEVPADTLWLIVEGAGVARRELEPYVDAVVWVASDPQVARARELARDGEGADKVAFIEEWAAAERAFMDHHRPWERADLIVCGTPDRAVAAGRLLVEP